MLECDFQNPAPFIVHVLFIEKRAKSAVAKPVPVSWPFDTQEEATLAYEMAVKSGQFTHCLRKATKKAPAVMVTHVQLWRLKAREVHLDGTSTPVYEGIPPWHEGPEGD